ncbi:uncharacterized protein HDA32_003798 [Spinactinospora alkalitolerans]|uniref:DUF418 domain-containing protein n=1 Tax=Spinactinospora alkalitolerans TaxID=687207 RepID=A0A852TXK5_9ACTN|nr:DUF418 domain-containing protein [Spinactinospora alkalitolerans]NYE48678.1 uncharacterized protein [Spinactinospora alkalitolerans]
MDTTAQRVADRAHAAPAGRLPLLDVLRGAAILGTLATNVWIFAGPGGDAGPLIDTGAAAPAAAELLEAPTAAGVAEFLFRFAANGKFLALLTLLFGVGLAIQFRSAAKRGSRWPGRYKWRALFLLLEGALHFTLVFAWDVLMGYAATALLVAWLLTRSERAQRIVMWAQAALHVAFMAALTALLYAPAASPPQDTAPPPGTADVVRLYVEGGYLDQVLFRLENFAVLRIEPVITFPLLVFLFLLGVRLLRAGAFDPDDTGRRLRVRMLAWGLGIGLPLNLATALLGPNLFLIDRYVCAPVLALGYIGLIGVLMDRVRRPGTVTAGLSALGRTAMSGYVLQNALCMLLCYGIGLGLASRLAGTGPWWVLGLWAAVSLTLLVAAPLWLRRFPQGPLEGLQKWVLTRIPDRSRR